MSAQTDVVFHRRNKPIQEAIDSRNLKQALQLIDKRVKKGEDTRFLKVYLFAITAYMYCNLQELLTKRLNQAWRAHVLYLHPDETHSQQGIAATLDLCRLEPPTTDLDTLELLHSTLSQLKGHDDVARAIWEKAAKAKPQELEIQSRWFSVSFEADAWKSAQKVRPDSYIYIYI